MRMKVSTRIILTIYLVVVILLIGVAFIGIGVAVTNSTVNDTQTTEVSEN